MNSNIAAAFRIVLRKVKAKFDRGVAAAEAKIAAEEMRAMHRHVAAGSSGVAIETMGINSAAAAAASSSSQLDSEMFHDLWATMTQGWAADDDVQDLGLDTNDTENFGHF
ncbi:hypothetical protein PG987_005545 [Apiospora arundinis]